MPPQTALGRVVDGAPGWNVAGQKTLGHPSPHRPAQGGEHGPQGVARWGASEGAPNAPCAPVVSVRDEAGRSEAVHSPRSRPRLSP